MPEPFIRHGGTNGHLALIMPDADYLARANQAFLLQAHPDTTPVHAEGSTATQITKTNRQYQQDLVTFALSQTVGESLKRQILAAVEPPYLQALEDLDFGYAGVTPQTTLAHLKEQYGEIINEEIEANCTKLNAEWNPDETIEDLWLRITEVQRYATRATKPITDATAVRLTPAVLEQIGVFITDCYRRCAKEEATQTLANFKLHLTRANKERIHSRPNRPATTALTWPKAGPNQHRPKHQHHPLLHLPWAPQPYVRTA
jgi:hypothetical protein